MEQYFFNNAVVHVCPKSADDMAASVNPDQTAHSLIWIRQIHKFFVITTCNSIIIMQPWLHSWLSTGYCGRGTWLEYWLQQNYLHRK